MISILRPSPAVLTALAAAASLLPGSRASAAEPDATPTAPPAATAIVTPAPAAGTSPATPVMPAPTPAPTPVISPAQHAAAEELVAAMHTETVVQNANKQLQQNIDQVAEGMSKTPNISPELTGEVQKMREDASTLITQKLGWDTMKEDVIRSYAEEFTDGELKEIAAFYRTPTGEKLIEKQSKLADKLTRTMRQRSMMVVSVLRQRIQTLTIKLRPPAPIRPLASPGVPPAAPTATTAAPPVTSAPVSAPTATAASSPVP